MSTARAPRCQISINGVAVAPIECNVHISIHQSADTFYAKLPILRASGLDEAFWASTAPIPVEIDGTNDINSGSYSPLLIGQVDEAQLIFNERAVSIKGRDKTAALTEQNAKNSSDSSQVWRNKSNQNVIADLAAQAGLSVVFNGFDIDAGLQYDQDYSELSDSDSAWNMIIALARKAGCIAFVKGMTLYVQPIDTTPPNGMYMIKYQPPAAGSLPQSNAVLLFATRNLPLAKDTTVTVQSWRHKAGDAITSTYESKPKSASADRLIYQHRAANLTKNQQDRIALAHLKETLSHERQIDAQNFPGDVSVVAGLMGLTLSGTGTAFDQDYVLADVVHHFDNEGGYTMDLSAHSQDAGRGEPDQLQ